MLIQEIAKEITDTPITSSNRTAVVDRCIMRLREAHPNDLPGLLADAGKVEDAIKNIIFSVGTFWRNLAVPALLQDEASFADLPLITAATNPASAIPSAWAAGEAWVTPWAEKSLNGSPGFFTPAKEGDKPVADHPLILRAARKFLLARLNQPAGNATALEFAQWAVERSLENPNKAFSVGDLLIALAEQRQITVLADGSLKAADGHDSQQWKDIVEAVLDGIVKNSERNGLWRDQETRIAELLNACPPWKEGARRSHLQRRAQQRLRGGLETLNAGMESARAVFPGNLNEVDEATAILDTTVRFTEPFWRNTIEHESYLERLKVNSSLIEKALSDRPDIGGTARMRKAAESMFEKQQDFVSRNHSPIVRAETFRAMAPYSILQNSAALAFMQRQGAELSADRLLQTMTDPETWLAQVQKTGVTEEEHSKAWRVLEAWDGLRGRGTAVGDEQGKAAADELHRRLAVWLTGTETALPPNADLPADSWQELRPLLAAVTLLGLSDDKLKALHGRLRNVIGQLDQQQSSLRPLLAAAHIELALTRMVSGATELAAALDLLPPGNPTPDPEPMQQLANWSAAALNSPFAWESRAGMNGLILLCRLAETSGNIFAANLLPAVSTVASKFIVNALYRLRKGERTGEYSDLPLAFVAFDLARARREAAEGLLPQTAAALAAQHPWLENFTPHSLIEDLVDKLCGGTNIATSFVADTRLAGRTLLLALFEAQLGIVQQQQRLRITPLDGQDAEFVKLDRIKNKARQLFCIERILLSDSRRLEKLQEEFVPWWRIGFWSDELVSTAASDEKKQRRLTEGTVSWLASFNGETEARLLAWAADLESAVPVPNPNSDRDIDGRSVWALPKFTWGRAMEDLNKAIAELQTTETEYKDALKDDIVSAQRQEFTKLLSQPLELNTADFREQIDEAIADVRAAEADLEAARHLSLAAEMETIAADLFYEAAKYETERRGLLEAVAEREKEVKQLNTEIAPLKQKIQDGEVITAEQEIQLRENMKQSAAVSLEMAEAAHSALKKRIELLNHLLREQHTHNGTKVFGKIGLMGAQICDTLTAKLAADLDEAKKDLASEEEKERKRKKLERQNRMIKAALRFVGAVVGCFFGNPALGAEIGGAIAELREGLISNKPPEQILFGLVDNGMAIAQASGVDLKSELNALGKKGAEKATAFFNKLESGLGPIFETMPKLLDEQVFKDALVVLGLDAEVPDFMQRMEKTYKAFKKDAGSLGNLGDALFGQDANGKTVLKFDDPKKLRDHLKDNLFGNTQTEVAALKKVAKQIGSDLKKLETPAGQKEATERLANLIITKVSEEAVQYRGDIIRQWSLPKVQAGKLWKDEDVQKEAKLLLDSLYPNEKDRKELEKGLERLLGGRELFQAQVESLLAPWQRELDKRIAEISKAGSDIIAQNPPNSAVAAARARVAYIEEFQQRLGALPSPSDGTLAAWLLGNSQERRDLFIELDRVMNEAEQSRGRLRISMIDFENREIEIRQAVIVFENAQHEAHIAGIERLQADLELEEATLLVRVSKLAGLEAGNIEAAKKASADASEFRQKAAKQLIIEKEAELVAAKARQKGAEQRGSVTRRIRSSLSLPAFSFSSAGAAAFAREEHAEALNDAFRAIRELLRHVRAAGVELGKILEHLKILRADGGANLWSTVIIDCKEDITKKVIDEEAIKPDSGILLIPLNNEHIQHLIKDGLRIFVAPRSTNEEYEGRIEIFLSDHQVRNGRILAFIFCGVFVDNDDVNENDMQLGQQQITNKEGIHLGDRWLSPTEAHAVDATTVRGNRLYLSGRVKPGNLAEKHKEWFDHVKMIEDFTGFDPCFKTHVGVSLSGTHILRLEKAPAAPEIKELSIVIPYVYYDR